MLKKVHILFKYIVFNCSSNFIYLSVTNFDKKWWDDKIVKDNNIYSNDDKIIKHLENIKCGGW